MALFVPAGDLAKVNACDARAGARMPPITSTQGRAGGQRPAGVDRRKEMTARYQYGHTGGPRRRDPRRSILDRNDFVRWKLEDPKSELIDLRVGLFLRRLARAHDGSRSQRIGSRWAALCALAHPATKKATNSASRDTTPPISPDWLRSVGSSGSVRTRG